MKLRMRIISPFLGTILFYLKMKYRQEKEKMLPEEMNLISQDEDEALRKNLPRAQAV